MERTPEENAAIKTTFAVRRRNQLVVAVPMVAALVGFAFTQDKAAHTILGLPAAVALPSMLVVVVGALIFSRKNWRCPACTKYLGKQINPKYCHACGVELR